MDRIPILVAFVLVRSVVGVWGGDESSAPRGLGTFVDGGAGQLIKTTPKSEQSAENIENGDVLLQMTYMDAYDDTKWFDKYVSIEGLRIDKLVDPFSLFETAQGPKMQMAKRRSGAMPAAGGDKNDNGGKIASNQKAVWRIRKGYSRDDCVAFEPLLNPGWFLRVTKVQVGGERESELLGETADLSAADNLASQRMFNTMFSGPTEDERGEAIVDTLSDAGIHVDESEFQAVKQPQLAETNTATATVKTRKATAARTVTTIIMSKNDGSLSFLKEATWCIRNARAASVDKSVKVASIESMSKPGFFLMRKAGGKLVGLGLGSNSAVARQISWQLASPKFQLCPKHCNGHGECKNVIGTKGTCKCHEGYSNADCGVLANWPILNETSASKSKMIPVMQAMQALFAYKGVPQDYDGKWNNKFVIGSKTYLTAKGMDEAHPLNAIVWESLTTGTDVKSGMGKDKTSMDNVLVKAVQRLLNRAFAYKNPVTGVFDAKTEKDVKDFQSRMHLKKAEGVVDKFTWNKLVADLPPTIVMWPIEKSYQPYPDQQLYYLQDNNEKEYANCQISGMFVWDKDIPGRSAVSPEFNSKNLKAVPQGGGTGIGHTFGKDKGIADIAWKDKNGKLQDGTRSLRFVFAGVYKGGFADCNEIKGFDNGAHELTVEMFFKPATVSQKAALFSTCDKDMNGFYLGYRGYSLRVGISAESYLDAPVKFFENTWHHVAATFKGDSTGTGKLKLYLDGEKIGEKTIPEKSIPWRTKKKMKPVVFGGFSGDLRYEHFWGQIDNIRVSRVALDSKDLLVSKNPVGMNPPTTFYADKASIQSKLPFAYKGKKGPGSWTQLSSTYGLCSTGNKQSPIDLPSPVSDGKSSIAAYKSSPASHLKYIEMAYHSVDVISYWRGVQMGFDVSPAGKGPGELILNDDHYVAKQVLFHTPSEHTIGGLPVEMEMQIRHEEKTKNSTVIVSILIKRGRPSAVLEPILENLRVMKQPASGIVLGKFDLLDVIPYDPGFVTYTGSLTHPPCTEGIRWVVIDGPMTASMAQIEVIKNFTGDNSRPRQARNGRVVKRISIGTESLLRQTESMLRQESALLQVGEGSISEDEHLADAVGSAARIQV